MNIKINKVEIKNSGPLVSFSEEFKPLTVIYGKNESGKTTIVENIISALFKKGSKNKAVEYLPSLRGGKFSGGVKVEIEGLEKNIVSFNGKESLDEILQREGENLPLSLLNLLFVKEGDSKVIGDSGGLTKDLLKEMIAGSSPLKKIGANLSKAIREIRIEDGKFNNFKKNIKESRDYLEACGKIEKLQELENDYWQNASELQRIQVEKKIKHTARQLHELEQARKHSAFKIAQDLEKIKEDDCGFSEEELSRLLNESSELERAITQKNKISNQLKEFTHDQDNLYWLDISKDNYYKFKAVTSPQRSKIFIKIAALLLLLTIGLSFVNYLFVPIIGFFSFLSLVGHLWKNRSLSPNSDNGENNLLLAELEKNFFQRFGKQLNSIEDLMVELKILTERKGSYNALNKQFGDLEQTINSLEISRGQLIVKIGGNKKQLNIEEYVHQKKKELRQREVKIVSLSDKLIALDVDASDYLASDPGVAYSWAALRNLEQIRSGLKDELAELIEVNNNKRQELSGIVGSLANISPSEVSDQISAKLVELKAIKESNLTKIIGDYYLNEVLTELKSTEDERLKYFINSPEVLTRLKDITNNYEKIDFKGDDLVIENDIDSFLLKNLSTGSNEQILLALRMGIAEKLSQSSSLFMILDDAFQFSDWDRRDKLISTVVAMVKSGWQIIYFTMDDDIRDRFKIAAKKMSNSEFKLKELS